MFSSESSVMASENGMETEESDATIPRLSLDNYNAEEDVEFEELVQAYLRDVHYASRKQSVVKIFHAVLNAAVVVLPFAACHAGLPLYMALVVGMAALSAYSSILIVRMANDQKIRTYEGLAEYAFGPIGFFVVCGCQLLLALTTMCISLDVWADIVGAVASEVLTRGASNAFLYDLLTSRSSVVILGGLLVFPFCIFTKSLVSLAWSSYCAVLAVLACLLAVISSFYLGAYSGESEADAKYSSVLTVKENWWVSLFVITLCFSYNHKAFVVYNCMRRRNTKRWRFAVQWSHCVIAAIYIFLGSFGYMSDATSLIDAGEQNQCQGQFDYFASYHSSGVGGKTIFHVARIVVAVSLLFAFPVDSLVAVTTYKRVHRRYRRFMRFVRSDQWNHSHSRSHLSGSGDSVFNSPVKSSAAGAGVEDRDSLLYNLLEMPTRHPGEGSDSGYFSRLSTALMPCFFTPRSVSRRSAGTTADGSSFRSRDADDEHDDSKHQYQAVPTQAQAISPGELAAVAAAGGDVPLSRSLPNESLAGGDSDELVDGCSRSSPAPEAFHRTESLPPVLQSPETDSDFAFIQSQIQTEQTINHIRGSAGSRGMSSISSTSRHPSFVSPSSNTLTLPVPDVTVLHDEDLDLEGGGRESLFSSSGGGSGHAGGGAHREGRHNSLAAVLQPRSFSTMVKDGLPPALMWMACVTICLLIEKWVLFAGTIGILCTSILVFLLPSMIYFRVGSFSDFQATPFLCNTTIPNRLYMFWLQVFGLCGMLAALGLVALVIAHPSIYQWGYADDV